MPRSYTHVKKSEKQINEMRKEGKSRREIADHFGLTIKQIMDFVTRYNRKQKKIEQGVSPKQRGRKPAITLQEYKYENKRLKMENELLRDFLSEIERG